MRIKVEMSEADARKLLHVTNSAHRDRLAVSPTVGMNDIYCLAAFHDALARALPTTGLEARFVTTVVQEK